MRLGSVHVLAVRVGFRLLQRGARLVKADPHEAGFSGADQRGANPRYGLNRFVPPVIEPA